MFKENLGGLTLIGKAEYKMDIADGDATNDDTNFVQMLKTVEQLIYTLVI